MHPVIEWKNNRVIMLDQRKLPFQEQYIAHSDHQQVADSIRKMVIRGAPAIGVAAAMGIALGVLNAGPELSSTRFEQICETLLHTRPTAVNLSWAVRRMAGVYRRYRSDYPQLRKMMVREALHTDRQDVRINRKIGKQGCPLLSSGQTILTHCNAGALATAGYGTALGVIRAAVEEGKKIQVIASETRPYLQGARLTVWELQRDRIPVRLITDNMAGHLMARRRIDAVITGADRIAANGDTANKIGTFSLAVLARYHRLPFYVAAPVSTIDPDCPSGDGIPIEERDPGEVLRCHHQPIAPEGTPVYNPAFDVTPAGLISAIITEAGVLRQEYSQAIAALFS